MHELKRRTQIAASLEDVFNFFSDAGNLDQITPPWLKFKILTPTPIPMELNTKIDFSLKLNGIPFQWKSQITVWDPPAVFVDEQISGPYRQWIHTHRFSENEAGTAMEDHVSYSIPGWIVEPLIHTMIVRSRLERIFDYREAKLKEILGPA